MGSRRTTIIFFLIVGLAVIIVVTGLFFQALSGLFSESTPSSPTGTTTSAGTPMPQDAVVIEFRSSNTKENWIDEIVADFNAGDHRTASGKPIVINAHHVTSGGSYQAIMDGEIQPVIWSPGSGIWVDKANQTWRDRTGRPLIPNAEACPSTLHIPLVIGMWRPMAEALGWPEASIGWADLADLATNPEGWAAHGHPEWGTFKFGHAHPDFSNSAMLSVIAEVYAAAGKTAGLTAEDVKSATVREHVGAVEQTIVHYGKWDKWILDKMVERGPGYLHATPTYENNVVLYNMEHASELHFPLVSIYPREGTFWVTNPACILDADWVSDEQKEAAEVFLAYMIAPEQQARMMKWALRPADTGVPLSEPVDLAHGAIPSMTEDQIPALEEPSEQVTAFVSELWHDVKKKAVAVVLLDRSGSMKGDKIKAALEGVNLFIDQMEPDDEIVVIAFNHEIAELEPSGKVGQVSETLRQRVNGLYAEGGTALHWAVILGLERVEKLRQTYGDDRLYGVVLLSDGKNEAEGGPSRAEMLSQLPEGTEASGTKVFTIAYGDDADLDLLVTLANRTNALSLSGTEEDISEIYLAISSYF
jgi:Ca-activated chloride channel family protein